MATDLTLEQYIASCLPAIGDVIDTGKTTHTCPICGGKFIIHLVGDSGSIRCENGCFKEKTFRGI